MRSPLKAVTTILSSAALGLCACAGLAPSAFAKEPSAVVPATSPPVAHLRWLVELGAESLVAKADPDPTAAAVVVSIPGAAFVFGRGSDGRLVKRARLPADSAAANGLAVHGSELALADRLGTVSLWTVPATGELELRWRRDVGGRVTSIGWAGGPLVLVATWEGSLTALAVEDGAPKWSVDIGGRAEAPAVVDDRSVYIATKTRTLFRVDARTGAVRWRAELPGLVLHRPALVKEVASGVVEGAAPERTRQVVVGSWDGQLVAYEAVNGRLSWSTSLGERPTAAPLVAPGLVAVVTADGAVRAYDLAGHALWTTPDAAIGPATLIWQETAGTAPRLLSASRVLVALSPFTGERLADYPSGAREELENRFAEAMLEGIKTYTGAEKLALGEQEAFEIAGPLFGPARLAGDTSSSLLAFGSEEGWAYLFDAGALRPLVRYRAGSRAQGVPCRVESRVVATTGEDIYALDADTGRVSWRRTVGGEPRVVGGDGMLAVRAGGRVHAIESDDGSLAWSFKGGIGVLAPGLAPPPALPPTNPAAPPDAAALPPADPLPAPAAPSFPEATEIPWLAGDDAGQLRALVAPGRFVGEALPLDGELLSVVATGPRTWLAATREGTLYGIAWEEPGRLVSPWQRTWGEPLAEMQVAADRVLLRSASGTLASVDLDAPEKTWQLATGEHERVVACPGSGALLVLGRDTLRVHDATNGVLKHEQALSQPALAADVRGELPPALGLPIGGGELRWLDHLGHAHRAPLGGERAATTDLGVTLAGAAPVEEGFLATTAAGEVAMVVFDREE